MDHMVVLLKLLDPDRLSKAFYFFLHLLLVSFSALCCQQYPRSMQRYPNAASMKRGGNKVGILKVKQKAKVPKCQHAIGRLRIGSGCRR